MRISEQFAEARKSEIKTYKSKYFIASEGSNSEPLYFDGLNNSIITENITIVNILRDYATLCNSHPSFIIKMMKEFVLNVTQDEITVLELLNKIKNFIFENKYLIDIKQIEESLLLMYGKRDKRINKAELNQLFLVLFKADIYKDLAENFPLYFDAQNVTYSPDVDKLNIVIDRDKQNFKDKQYDEVLEFCEIYHVNLYVSNPTFEFWLLLHFPCVLDENVNDLYENKYINSKHRYLEKLLHSKCKYKKSQLNFTVFEPYVKDAIKREKYFEEDIVKLKNNLGSNVGLLVKDMTNKKNN